MASSGSSSASRGTFALGPWGRIASQGTRGSPRPRVHGKRVGPPPRMAGTDRLGPRFPGLRCAQRGIVCSSCSFGTHVASPLSFLGRRCGLTGVGGVGLRGLGWGPLSSSSCGNGSRGALGLCLLRWLPPHNGLVPSAIEGWASLRFPFLFRSWRQIWPVLRVSPEKPGPLPPAS